MEAFAAKDRIKKEWKHPVRVRMGTGLHHPLPEVRFEAHLCHERMRAERSGRTIALVLVDCGQCFTPDKQEQGSAGILKSLCDSTRLTDIVGWHKENTVVGVIVTEFGSFPPSQAVECILEKFAPMLNRQLYHAQIAAPRIKAQFFPEDYISGDGDPTLDLTFYPDLRTQQARTRVHATLKRTMDLAGSSLALACLSPLLVTIALAIRISSPGPALYRQKRVGRFGVDFTMFKFRTMRLNAETGIHEEFVRQFIGGRTRAEENGGIYKLIRDPRVTRLGKFLRRTSLDELPQFVNVVLGSMSLVGPRPPLRYELDVYEPWHRKRLLDSKPGLTGLWQVSGRSRTRFDEMVRMDLRYAKKQSLRLDLALVIKTVRALISNDDAC